MTPVGEGMSQPSPLDLRCDEYIQHVVDLNPIAATDWGLGEKTGKLPDYSPAGLAAERELDASLLQYVHGKTWDSGRPNDYVTAEALEDRLQLSLDLHDSGENHSELNNLASPLQEIRDSFDLMDKATSADWKHILCRLDAVPQALHGHQESLSYGAAHGHVAASRQVEIVASQARDMARGKQFKPLLEEATSKLGDDHLERLSSAITAAESSFGDFATWLERELLPKAPPVDHVGRERYQRLSHLFVGAKVDLDETYQWGLDELARISDSQKRLAAQLYGPGTTVPEALQRLNQDPKYTINGATALQEWMQETANQAITDLQGTEFDIPAELTTIECMIAPSSDGGIYYTGPSANFTRPGRMWWSIPPGETTFHTWQERTTVFHEGVPGHHLQVGQAIAQSGTLNLWRRFASWNSGHGEGWALYAESLMAELGYQSDPGYLMGLLDSERLRAARVVLDIGVHLQKLQPQGSGLWDAAFAWQFLKDNVAMADGFLHFELNRYLGWPGQAPAYKVGERLWKEVRAEYEELATRGGYASTRDASSIRRAFHSEALSLGSLPMSTLRKALLKQVKP